MTSPDRRNAFSKEKREHKAFSDMSRSAKMDKLVEQVYSSDRFCFDAARFAIAWALDTIVAA
jgi:hypothetical protein